MPVAVFAEAKTSGSTESQGPGVVSLAGVLKACSMALRCAGGRVPACPVAGLALKGLRGINRFAIYSTVPCPRFTACQASSTAHPHPMLTDATRQRLACNLSIRPAALCAEGGEGWMSAALRAVVFNSLDSRSPKPCFPMPGFE